jgi:hypothetical protein
MRLSVKANRVLRKRTAADAVRTILAAAREKFTALRRECPRLSCIRSIRERGTRVALFAGIYDERSGTGKRFSTPRRLYLRCKGRRGYMKDLAMTFLALLAVVVSLVSLLHAGRAPDQDAAVVRIELPQRMPDIGPRFVLAAR